MLHLSSLARPAGSHKAGVGNSAGTAPQRAFTTPILRRRQPVARPTAYDPSVATAATELWSAIGAISVASAALYGLASIVRKANYDPEDIRLRELAREASASPCHVGASYASLSVDDQSVDVGYAAAQQPAGAAVVAAATAAAAAKQAEEQQLPGKLTTDSPAAAAAVLDALASDAPVAATPVASISYEAAAGEIALAGKTTVDEAAAAALAGKLTVDAAAAEAIAQEEESKEAVAAYEARLKKILADSTLAYQQTRRVQQQVKPKPQNEGDNLRQRVATLSAGYQEKINSLWQNYGRKRAEEQTVTFQGSETVALDLTVVEEANKLAKPSNPLADLWQRIVAFFAALIAWVARKAAQLLGGGSSSGAGATA